MSALLRLIATAMTGIRLGGTGTITRRQSFQKCGLQTAASILVATEVEGCVELSQILLARGVTGFVSGVMHVLQIVPER